jgi:hypothetical protein
MCISISSYFVFLVVVGVDDFFIVIFPSARLVEVCYWLCGLSMFLLRHALLNIVFVSFPLFFLSFISSLFY